MPIFNRTYSLLNMTSHLSTDQTGKAYALLSSRDTVANLRVFASLTQNGGADSPSVTVHLETSHDKVGWVQAITPLSTNQEGTVHKFEDVVAVGRYLRVRTVLAGGTKPTHKVAVFLASTSDLTVKPQS